MEALKQSVLAAERKFTRKKREMMHLISDRVAEYQLRGGKAEEFAQQAFPDRPFAQ